MSINVVVREGNLTKDVVYFAGSGEKKAFASFRVASYGGKDASDNKLTIYASVKCYGYLADQIKDCKKGDTVVFSGRVVSDNYAAADGREVQAESIVADNVTYRKKAESSTADEKVAKTTKAKPKAKSADDEVPF